MFKKWNQGCCRGDDLGRRNVHIFDLIARHHRKFAADAGFHSIVQEPSAFVQRLIGLGDEQVLLVTRARNTISSLALPFSTLR
jgi:hypothetical protein